MFQELAALYNKESLLIVIRILFTTGVGLLLAWMLRKITKKWLQQHATHHITAIASAFVWYTGILLIVIMVMHELGFHLSALLGAAGIIGIALGFAAQTSVSNIISGIFLIMEHSFEVGDYLEHEFEHAKVSGVVESIGLLSVSLRTYDNILIRVPNELLLKNIFINTTAYPIRRMRFRVRIPSSASIEAAKSILSDAVAHSSLLLKDPAPRIALDGTTNWSSEIMVRVWVSKNDVIPASEQLIEQIKQRADKANMLMAITRLANID